MTTPPNPLSNNTETSQEPQPSGYLARHNETIIGIFTTESDAQDAINGYQIDNNIDLQDILEVIPLL